MFRSVSRCLFSVAVVLPLASFRMPIAGEGGERMMYDVRGAFVTARPDVPQGLVIATDMLVDEAIRATVRSKILPRTIISVRIESTSDIPLIVGTRHEAKIFIQAVSVASGEPVAEGRFTISTFMLGREQVEETLAEKISDRIVSEFRLQDGRRSALQTALFDRIEP